MSLAHTRIVIADDNDDAAQTLARLLKLKGYTVAAIARDGESALAAIQRERPTIALLDIGMPGMSGLAVAARLRNEPARPLLVAITGWGTQRDRQEALDAGFDEHLCKPVEWQRLAEILNQPGPT